MTQQPLQLAQAAHTQHCRHCTHAVTGEQPERTGLCWARRNGNSSLRWNASTADKCAKYKERVQ